MLDHPFSVFGWLVAGAGFALLIFWVPTGVPSPGFGVRVDSVFNMHKAHISQAILLTGLAMVIAGVIAGGFEALRSSRREATGGAARSTKGGHAEEKSDAATDGAQVIEEPVEAYQYKGGYPDFSQLKEIHVVRRGMFRRHEIFEMNGGQCLFRDSQGWRPFASKEEAVEAATFEGK